MMISINEMTPDELRHYRKFSYENFLQETSKSSGKTIEQLKIDSKKLSTPSNSAPEIQSKDLWLSIKSNNQNIGYMWVQLYPEKQEAFGYDIFIEESFRSKGIGREVMLKCSDYLKKEGINKIKICVFQNNAIARKLYDSLEFKEISFDEERKQYMLGLAF